jgi:hypothetical protein
LRSVNNPDIETIDNQLRSDFDSYVEGRNISTRNFFITKARIELLSIDKKENILASIKYLYPDTYLISIRNVTGIEAARIYITKDTLIINDRINRQILYGKPKIVGRKYGVTPEIFPIFLGDLIGEKRTSSANGCDKGFSSVNSTIDGAKIQYLLDCKRGKAVSAIREGSNNKDFYKLSFEKFNKIGDLIYPESIKVEYSDMKINIRIEKIEYPWTGSIEFIPGKNYETVELL